MRVPAALGTPGRGVHRTRDQADLCIQGQVVLHTTVPEVQPILVLAVHVTRGPVVRATQVQAERGERVLQYADNVEGYADRSPKRTNSHRGSYWRADNS